MNQRVALKRVFITAVALWAGCTAGGRLANPDASSPHVDAATGTGGVAGGGGMRGAGGESYCVVAPEPGSELAQYCACLAHGGDWTYIPPFYHSQGCFLDGGYVQFDAGGEPADGGRTDGARD